MEWDIVTGKKEKRKQGGSGERRQWALYAGRVRPGASRLSQNDGGIKSLKATQKLEEEKKGRHEISPRVGGILIDLDPKEEGTEFQNPTRRKMTEARRKKSHNGEYLQNR